ncbi:MAG TPA: Flp pilus assembly protein CpaB [Gammaproteobacteria bacterium]|nr:Flp pilus assembly protein CpaB [Gammaproteobacteria bacterium]
MAEQSAQKTWLILAGAVFFGLFAALLSVIYLKSREAAIRESLAHPESAPVAVVVAKTDLPKGMAISKNNVAVREIPQDYVHPDAVAPGDFGQVAGKLLTQPLAAGKPLLKSFISTEIARDFSDTLIEGRRAVTIQVDEVNSIGGLMRPGNHVDIFAKLPMRYAGFETEAAVVQTTALSAVDAAGKLQQAAQKSASGPTDVIVPILQDALVLATGKEPYKEFEDQLANERPRDRERNFSTLTLDVTPRQAGLLKSAADKGDLIAVLRRRDDRSGIDFTGILPTDIFRNATELARSAAARSTARSADGVTVDADGKIVTRDGIAVSDPDVVMKDGKLVTKDGVDLSGLGLTVNDKGQLVTRDGRVVNAKDIIVSKDGTIMTKDGRILNPGTEGVRVTADGFVITKDGKVMTKDGVVLSGVTVTADGKVVTADGRVLKADEISLQADGSIKTKDGKILAGVTGALDPYRAESLRQAVVTKEGGVVLPDGTVITAGALAQAGLTVNDKGQLVTADGRVVDPKDLVVTEDGTVKTREGAVLASAGGARVTADGFIITKDGKIMTKDGIVISGNGVHVTEDGRVVTADGRVLKADEIKLSSTGVVMTKDGKVIAGVTGNRDTAALQAALQSATAAGTGIDLIVGGNSQDGVAKVGSLPLLK